MKKNSSSQTRGIVIAATGSPYYGRMAYNLAISIKSVEDMPITVITAGKSLSHLTDDQKGVFDTVIDREDLINIGSGSKLFTYELSPYEQTLVIDADNLWLPGRKPSEMMDALAGIQFTAITEGYHDIETGENHFNPDYPFWADLEDTIGKYKLKRGKIFQWRSEVIYFEKGEAAKSLFDKAKKVFEMPKSKVIVWGNGVPDEYAINVAAAQLGIEPHIQGWEPTWWMQKKKRPETPAQMTAAGHYIFSTGGNNSSPAVKKIYNNIAAASHRSLGLQYLFTLQSKSQSLPNRQNF